MFGLNAILAAFQVVVFLIAVGGPVLERRAQQLSKGRVVGPI